MDHLRQVHQSKLSNTQLRVLADRNARRTGKLFDSCPLCGKDDVDDSSYEHIVGHLRSLALKSLPPCEEDEVSDGSSSGNGSLGTSKPHTRSTLKDFKDSDVDESDPDGNDDTEAAQPDIPFYQSGERNPVDLDILEKHLQEAEMGESNLNESWVRGFIEYIEDTKDPRCDPDTDPVICSMLKWKRDNTGLPTDRYETSSEPSLLLRHPRPNTSLYTCCQCGRLIHIGFTHRCSGTKDNGDPCDHDVCDQCGLADDGSISELKRRLATGMSRVMSQPE